jgi:hypothetical protein
MIVRDAWLRERMAIHGKVPDFALVVTVAEVFFHCAKCVMRSHLWEQDYWPDLAGLPSLARTMVDHAKLTLSVDEMQALIDESYRERMY